MYVWYVIYIHFILYTTDVQNGISQNTSECKLLLLFTQTVTHTCKADCIAITIEMHLAYMVSWTIVIEKQEMPGFVFYVAFLGLTNSEKPVQVV